jgi:hypothetical protein
MVASIALANHSYYDEMQVVTGMKCRLSYHNDLIGMTFALYSPWRDRVRLQQRQRNSG